MRALRASTLLSILLLVSCSSSHERTGANSSAIQNPAAATDYPESVLVNFFCSGTLLSPTVVLTAGHCKATTYTVTAPNASNQTATGSHDQSFFQGDPKSSHDVLLVFLDSPITLSSYPTIASTAASAGTAVVEIGRSQNGTISAQLWKTTDAVSILGGGDDLGFPYNYEARPDISQDGDSGGAVMTLGTHEIVAIVDTDTVEQSIAETDPIDLFARVDQLHDDITNAIAAGPPDAGSEGDASATSSDSTATKSSGGCSSSSRSPDNFPAFLAGVMLIAIARRRRTFGKNDLAQS